MVQECVRKARLQARAGPVPHCRLQMQAPSQGPERGFLDCLAEGGVGVDGAGDVFQGGPQFQ